MASESDFTPLFTLPRWSFGLRQLFLWTAAIAVGLVALRSASTIWVAAMLDLSLFVLAASVLLVVFRRGPLRAYWIGFATFGWLYMLLLVTSWRFEDPNANYNIPIRSHNLITQQLSSVTYHWLYDEAFEKYNASQSMSSGGGDGSYGGSMMGGMEGGYGMSGGMLGGGMPMGPGMASAGPPPPPLPPPGPNEGDFVNVAHSLWTLLLAALGGCLGYWLYTTGLGQADSPGSPVGPTPARQQP